MDINRKNEIVQAMIDTEFTPVPINRETVNLSLFDSFPINDIAALGPAFLPLIQTIQGSVGQFLGTANGTTEVLYRAILPEGASKMYAAKDGSGLLGATRGTNGLGQTRFKAVEVNKSAVNNAGTAPPKINPYMIAIAAMLMNINMKLNAIEQGQESLMGFLELKEQAKLEGNLNFLSDILNNYKLNWNNENYKALNHMKVLDIKQESEQSIILFKSKSESTLDEKALLHTTKNVSKNINRLITGLNSYRLSVYMYAFSSYVDVLMLENFDSEYLQRIKNKLKKYSLEYRETYTEVYSALERFTKRSVRSIASRGVAGVTKVLGKTVEKIPKISDTQIDETLLDASERITKFDIMENERISKHLINCQKVDVTPFVDGIQQIDQLYNSPIDVLISNDTLYIKSGMNTL